ncbi:DUF502 domain-containing protein [Blastomonas fulva]|uniref:DUF502 domain-containing protein n=1 Tax=Blastomonas fulva TaxID=1550728 RepID=UPI003F700299
MSRERPSRFLSRIVGPFITGLVFLAPVILTVILIQWVAGYVVAALGPDTLIGGLFARGGMLLTSTRELAFVVGLGVALLIIWALGLLIQLRAQSRWQGGFDSLLGRLPVIGGIYRPLAQLVRMIGKSPTGELQGMAVVMVRYGDDVEIMGLLATPRVFELGHGPQHLVMLPTAPVPIGGALMFVGVAKVRPMPELGVDDMAKFYVSMGTIAPAGLFSPPLDKSAR